MRHVFVTLIVAAGIACAPPPAVNTGSTLPEPTGAEQERIQSRELHWVRSSAEHSALFIQTYRAARERLEAQVRGRQASSWAAIMDADETVLDNSEYQVRLAQSGATFDTASWNAWVREAAAPALPGAVEYVNAVRSLGGKVVIVTNRDASVCDPTRENLSAVALHVDLVLCMDQVSDKGPRFDAVLTGTTGSELPALDIVQWIGDNIQDFPALRQSLRDAPEAALEPFGEIYFVLPNPMYGSFERNPER